MKMKHWKKYVSCILASLVIGMVVPPMASSVLQTTVVEAQAAKISRIVRSDFFLQAGDKEKVELKDAGAKNVKWKSKKKSVVTVDSNGTVTALKEGKGKIIAIYGNTKEVITVNVQTKEELEKTEKGRYRLAKGAAQSIIKSEGIDKLDRDVAKVKAVHDYLVLNAAYDYENLQNGTIPMTSYEAYGVIVLKTGVCSSYASAFKLFMDLLEIPCECISGYGNDGEHAWNAVTLDGERYLVDVTWDDPVPDTPGSVSYSYFLVDDRTLRKDHEWSPSVEPCTGTKYRTYLVEAFEAEGRKADNWSEVKEILKEQISVVVDGRCVVSLVAPADMLKDYEVEKYANELYSDSRYYNNNYFIVPERLGEYELHRVIMEVEEY